MVGLTSLRAQEHPSGGVEVSDEANETLTLRVAKAIPSDVGHGRARVPFDNELNLKPGDIVELSLIHI